MDTIPIAHGRSSPPPRDVEDAGVDGACNPYAAAGHHHLDPPRLQTASAVSRAVICCCLCVALLIVVAIFNIVLQLPAVESARGVIAEIVQPAARPAPLPRPPAARPLPATLRRFAALQRARPPDHGADPASLRQLFPRWFSDTDDEFFAEHAVRDLALGVATLVERELAEAAAALAPPAPPVDDDHSGADADL